MATQGRLLLWMVALGGLVLGLSVAVIHALIDPGRPIEIVSGRAVTPTVKAGEDVLIQFEVARNRPCPAVVNAFLVDATGAAVASYGTVLVGYTPVGKSAPTIRRQVPLGTTPGPVCYRSIRTDSCEEKTFVTPMRDVCFEVIP